MINYPNSLELEIYFEASHLYELCQLCLPVIEEAGLPSIRDWEIPQDSIPQSSGLKEKLAELRTQKEQDDEEAPHLSLFNLGEGDREQGRDIVLFLSYYKHEESYCAGQCGLDMYIHKHNTVEEVQDFVDHALDFCRRVIKKASVFDLTLYRSAGRTYIPDAPLVRDNDQVVFLTHEDIEINYDDPEAFWNYPWSSREHWRDSYLLTRCLDMEKYLNNGAYRAAIIEPHWNLIRAAKPGTIKYFRPYPKPEEQDIFNEGEPRLKQTAYLEDTKTLKYTCHLESDQHIHGWEIFEIYLQLENEQTKDEKELQQIQVIFDDRKTAQRELRPLLEAGAKVIYTNEDGQEIDIEQEAQLNCDKKQLAQLRSQLKEVEERIKQARKTNIFNRPQSGENEREKDRLTQEIQLLSNRIADRESAKKRFY